VQPDRKVQHYAFGKQSLTQILNLQESPFLSDESDGPAFEQLEYLESYVGSEELGCLSIAIEPHYIDRDYMEDHSVFYSRSLFPYPNWCQRAHFFSLPPHKAKAQLSRLKRIARLKGETAFHEACESFSDDHYLGFAVIRPLAGCPVGRTELHPNVPSTSARSRTDDSRAGFSAAGPRCQRLCYDCAVVCTPQVQRLRRLRHRDTRANHHSGIAAYTPIRAIYAV